MAVVARNMYIKYNLSIRAVTITITETNVTLSIVTFTKMF